MTVVNSKKKELDKKAHRRAVRIGAVAARLFNEKTYLDTSMDQIASAARLSKGAIYHYFPSKSDLLFFVLDNYLSLILQDLEEDLEKIEGTDAKLKFIIARHIELYVNHVPEAKTLLHDYHCVSRSQFKVIAEKERRYHRIVAGVLADALPEHTEEELLTVVTFVLFGMCNWIYAWYNPKGSVKPEELAEIIFGVFLHGVKGFLSSMPT